MGGVIEDHNLWNYSSACNLYFRKVIGSPLMNLIHADWEQVNY